MNDKEKNTLEAYKDTINRIDDWFEYANESKKDREFIHGELDKLTEKLTRIYRQAVRREDIVPTIKSEMYRVLKTAGADGLKNTCDTRAQVSETMRGFMFEFINNNSLIQKFQVLCNEWNNECMNGSIRMHVEIQFRGAKDTIRMEEIG